MVWLGIRDKEEPVERPFPIPAPVMERLRRKGPETRIAVVGASNNPEKYGHIIVRNLHGKGYTVLPIHPKEREIAGLRAYPTVAEAPPPIHVVNFVTPPAVTRQVLESLDPAVVDTVWFQDGSWDDEAIAAARTRFPHVVHQACIMMVTNY